MEIARLQKDQVVDAVWAVTKQIEGWNLPREYVEEYYERARIAERSGNTDEQINTLGYTLRHCFHDRYWGRWRGEPTKGRLFVHGECEEYIRLVDWVRSAKEGCLRLLY